MALKFLNSGYFAGKVGIGTDSPDAKLDIEGDFEAEYALKFTNTKGTGTVSGFRSHGVNGEDLSLYNGANRIQRWDENGNSIFDGKVGIGTSGPAYELDVNSSAYVAARIESTGAGYAPASILLQSGGSDSRGQGIYQYNSISKNSWFSGVPYSTTSDDWIIAHKLEATAFNSDVAQMSNALFCVNDSGFVGIGTTSSVYKLQVYDASSSQVRITNGLATPVDLQLFASSSSYAGIGTASNHKLALRTNSTEKVTILADGNVGIGITAPTSKLHINQDITNPDLDLPQSFAVEIDSNHSGTTATTGDREQGGLYIDVDSSTTGGDTADEHRVYGIYSDVRHSGDADRAVGVYSIAEQNTTAGATTYILGGEFVGVTDGGGSATVNTVAGAWGMVSMQDATPVVNSYGGYFRNYQATTRTGSTTSTYGLYTEVELNSDSAYTNIYGQRITIDVNTDAFTANKIALLDFSVTGLNDIPAATDTYAIHQPFDVKSYHEGNFGIASGNPESKLTVGGNAITTKKPTVAITDTTNGASLTLRGVSPVLYFDKTGVGVPKILMDGGGLEFKTGTLDAEGDVNFKINPDGSLQLAKGAKISNQENTDIDSAAAEVVAEVAISYTAAFFDFVVKKGTNVRSGTVYACHDGTNVEFTETSTNDLGDTSDVTLSVDKTSTNLRLIATVTSDDWSVKSLIRAI